MSKGQAPPTNLPRPASKISLLPDPGDVGIEDKQCIAARRFPARQGQSAAPAAASRWRTVARRLPIPITLPQRQYGSFARPMAIGPG